MNRITSKNSQGKVLSPDFKGADVRIGSPAFIIGGSQTDINGIVIEIDGKYVTWFDAILGAGAFSSFLPFLMYCIRARTILLGSFVLALLYNIAGLYFAV